MTICCRSHGSVTRSARAGAKAHEDILSVRRVEDPLGVADEPQTRGDESAAQGLLCQRHCRGSAPCHLPSKSAYVMRGFVVLVQSATPPTRADRSGDLSSTLRHLDELSVFIAALVWVALVGFGLLSVLFASFMLYRRHDIKRMFAYSSIEHMGIITFAFGMGGPLANFAGLLHMTYHSLTKSAIFFSVGHIAQIKGTQRMSEIRGLTVSHPVLGWGLVLGVMTIVGLPPMGIFMSEFLIITSTFARQPVLAVALALGLLVALGALLLRLNGLAFGDPYGNDAPSRASFLPMYAHLAVVVAAGIYLPRTLVSWFEYVARLLG